MTEFLFENIKKRRISRWFQVRWKSSKKIYQQKVSSKNVTEICTFSTFTHVRQTCFAYNFLWCIFVKLFQHVWYLFWLKKKSKNVLSFLDLRLCLSLKFSIHQRVCVLDFLKKKVKFVVAYCTWNKISREDHSFFCCSWLNPSANTAIKAACLPS